MDEAQGDRESETTVREIVALYGSAALMGTHDAKALLRLLDSERKRDETIEARCAVLEAALRPFIVEAVHLRDAGMLEAHVGKPGAYFTADQWLALVALAASPEPSGQSQQSDAYKERNAS